MANGGDDQRDERPGRSWGLWFLGGGIGAAVVLSGIFAIALANGTGPSHVTIDPLTSDGYAQLLADLQSGPGASKVRSVVINEHYAEVSVSTGPNGAVKDYQWDGTLGTPQDNVDRIDPVFDLSSIKVDDWQARCGAAVALLGDPKAECTITISGDRSKQDDQQDWIKVQAQGTTTGEAAIFYDKAGRKTGEEPPK